VGKWYRLGWFRCRDSPCGSYGLVEVVGREVLRAGRTGVSGALLWSSGPSLHS
jgi:hypothetical protein